MSDHGAVRAFSDHFGRSADKVLDDLESYAQLLRKWQRVQNLVSRKTLDELWTRHFADSLQATPLLRREDRQYFDFGSGGGFPALPMAIASKGLDRQFTLIEPTSRKVSFLRTVARELDLQVVVLGHRSDQIDSRETPRPDIITSRALAALPQLCAWMQPFWGDRTRALLHKGREHVEEVIEARAHWDFDVLIHPSVTEPGAAIVEISGLRAKSMR